MLGCTLNYNIINISCHFHCEHLVSSAENIYCWVSLLVSSTLYVRLYGPHIQHFQCLDFLPIINGKLCWRLQDYKWEKNYKLSLNFVDSSDIDDMTFLIKNIACGALTCEYWIKELSLRCLPIRIFYWSYHQINVLTKYKHESFICVHKK